MKVQIKRLADGGGFATFMPIMKAAPAMNTSGAASNSNPTSEDPSKGSSLLDEKMMEFLYKGNGLVNDVNKFVVDLMKIENSSQLPYMNNSNRKSSLQVIAKINEIGQNKKYWDDAISRSKEAGGLGEVAVDNSGRIFTKTSDNKIQSISLAEYSKKKDKIRPLSVQELLYERQYNPSLTEQNNVFTVADNAIGLNKITDHIKGMISALGTESNESNEIYSKGQVSQYMDSFKGKTPTADELNSLKILNQVLSSPTELSKITTEISTEKNHIKQALNYIWKTLGTNAQQKLSATAVMNNSNPIDLIASMLESGTNIDTKSDISPITDPKDPKSGSGSGTDTGKIALTPAEMFYMDKLHRPGTYYTINNPNVGIELNMVASGIGPLYGLTGKAEVVGPTTVNTIMHRDNLQTILDPKKAYIGDTRIDMFGFDQLAYSGDDVAKVYMPINPDGSPDLAGIEKFSALYKKLQENKDTWSALEAEKFFANNNFPGIKIQKSVDSNGETIQEIIENGTVKPFLAIPVLTNSATNLADLSWMTKLTGALGDQATAIMDQAFTVIGGTASKPVIKSKPPSAWNSLEKPFKGTLFVAFRPEASANVSSFFGHLRGMATQETDVQRNLYNSSNSVGPISASAEVFNN